MLNIPNSQKMFNIGVLKIILGLISVYPPEVWRCHHFSLDMANVTATWSPSSLQLRWALNSGNCSKPSLILVRMRWVRVLCVAQDRGRSAGNNGLQRGCNRSSWVESKPGTADGLSGWSGSDDEEDSQKKKWSGGHVGAGVAGVILVAGVTFAALSSGKKPNTRPKPQMEPLTTEQEVLLVNDDVNDRNAGDVDEQSDTKQDGGSLEEKAGTNKDYSSSREIDVCPGFYRVGNDYDLGELSLQEFEYASGGGSEAINSASIHEDLQHESTSDDKSVEPEMLTRQLVNDNIALMKERAAVESEMEVLARLRHEVEEQLENLMSNKVEISFEKERVSKLRKDAENESQEIARLQYDLEVERKALSMARAWAEDEAKRAREQAKSLTSLEDLKFFPVDVSSEMVLPPGGGVAAGPVASSSSSSPPVQWTYDVFLSFRGPDTRRSITSYLYYRLQRRGIKTFMDDPDLQVGDVISPALLKAIEGSRFAIVVLSENFAHSTWCLEELTKICEFMEGSKRIFPLFYDVEPSDVRYRTKSFGEAFNKHARYGRHTLQNLRRWIDALNKVSSFSGWHTKNYKTDIELVEAIVDFVCNKIQPIDTEFTMSYGDFESYEATRKSMDEVMKALKDLYDEVTADGVGGVGKTTMVKHVAAQSCKNGTSHHVIMAVVSQSPDLTKIQGTLAGPSGCCTANG